jgi:hypothetical protein
MLGMCLAPLILMGQMFTIETPTHKSQQNHDSQIIEMQTCETGLGMHAKASANGFYGMGMHYGFTLFESGKWSAVLQPKAGMSYVDHPVYELPQRTQFEVGGQLLLGYGNARVGVEYWHLSNAGMTKPNIGQDFLILSMGWRF